MILYDSHLHTVNSPDAGQTAEEICQTAIDRNLSGIAITDHVDMWFHESTNTFERISRCIEQTNAVRQKYHEKLRVFQGIEMAEFLYDPQRAAEIMKLTDYDIILASVHSVIYEDWTDSYSRISFSENRVPTKKIMGFMHEYFKRVTEMADKTDFDVLSHLTCPVRYINGKFGRGIELCHFEKEIDEILSIIIKRGIALEINTSGVKTSLNSFMPDSNIIKRYYKMGGRLITIGSDAHITPNIGSGLDEAAELLKSIGFKSYNYFEKRVPYEVPLCCE